MPSLDTDDDTMAAKVGKKCDWRHLTHCDGVFSLDYISDKNTATGFESYFNIFLIHLSLDSKDSGDDWQKF